MLSTQSLEFGNILVPALLGPEDVLVFPDKEGSLLCLSVTPSYPGWDVRVTAGARWTVCG